MMKQFHGIGISAGAAIGPVFRYINQILKVDKAFSNNPDAEEARLQAAIDQSAAELEDLIAKTKEALGENSNEAEIFDAHLMLLYDPELMDQVKIAIQDQRYSADYAWYEATQYYSDLLSQMESEYLAARSSDILDVAQRVLRNLKGVKYFKQADVKEPSIIVADELSPSDTVAFEKSKVLGFATISGGPTSHVAILSKAMGIPAIVGIGDWIDQVKHGQPAIIDGFNGRFFVNPDDKTIAKYKDTATRYGEAFDHALAETHLPAIMPDGRQIEVVANIGNVDDAISALELGAEGVGLLRTEFIFLDRDSAPTEEEQYEIYREIFSHFGQRPVVIRTLDIGGDKPAPYLNLEKELNPFLGLRGARLALAKPEIFQTQLRAIIRAADGFNIKVMFPMISTVAEIRTIKEQIKLAQDSTPAGDTKIEWGVMVEVPSAAVMAASIAKEVDFFSIGTNDLSQYTLAAERGNSAVALLADALDPSVLHLIKGIVEAAHAENKWVGLCGELAGDGLATPVLLGLGIDEFSMNPRSIPIVKQLIRKFTEEQVKSITNHVLNLPTVEDVRTYLKTFIT